MCDGQCPLDLMQNKCQFPKYFEFEYNYYHTNLNKADISPIIKIFR